MIQYFFIESVSFDIQEDDKDLDHWYGILKEQRIDSESLFDLKKADLAEELLNDVSEEKEYLQESAGYSVRMTRRRGVYMQLVMRNSQFQTV